MPVFDGLFDGLKNFAKIYSTGQALFQTHMPYCYEMVYPALSGHETACFLATFFICTIFGIGIDIQIILW